MIWAFITSLLSSPTILAIGAAFIAAMGWGFRREVIGARKERAKQAASEARARDEVGDIQNDVGAMTPEQRREALRKYARD